MAGMAQSDGNARAGRAAVLAIAAIGALVLGVSACDRIGPDGTPPWAVPGPESERRQAGAWREGSPSGATRAAFLGWHRGRIWGVARGDDPRVVRLVAYDPSLDRWTDHGGLDRMLAEMASSGAVVDGRAYLFGHVARPPDPDLRVWTIDLDSGASSFEADLAEGRGTSAAGPEGVVYYLTDAGTDAAGEFTAQALRIYDPATGAWREAPPMPTERASASLVVDPNGTVYVIAGEGPSECVEIEFGTTQCRAEQLLSIDRYDPVDDTWARWAELPASSQQLLWEVDAVVGADGGLYIARVVQPAPNAPDQPFAMWNVTVDRLDPETRLWTTVGLLPGTGATRLFASDDGWLVDLGEGQWAAAGELNIPVWTTRVAGF